MIDIASVMSFSSGECRGPLGTLLEAVDQAQDRSDIDLATVLIAEIYASLDSQFGCYPPTSEPGTVTAFTDG